MSMIGERRVAVIGGTGFIGSHLTEQLVAEGADVLAVARSETRLTSLASVRASCVVALADVCEAAAIDRILRRFRPEIVYFMAAHPDGTESFRHISECMRTNGVGLVNALQAAGTVGAEVFVYGDSAKDYGNADAPYRAAQPASPVCSYAILKAAGWQLCQLVACFTPMKMVALRPTLVYGPRQNRNVITYVRDCVVAGRPVRLMGGSQTRDPLYVDDAVRAYIAAATQSAAWGQAIPIGGGQELTVTSLCEAVVAALKGSVPVVPGAEQSRLTEIWRSSSDNTDASRLLDWRPQVSLSEGIARTVRAWNPRAQPAADVTTRPRRDCYLRASATGVVYRVLDLRDGTDRRAAARGGRRPTDAQSAVAAMAEHVHGDLPAPIAFDTTYASVGGEAL